MANKRKKKAQQNAGFGSRRRLQSFGDSLTNFGNDVRDGIEELNPFSREDLEASPASADGPTVDEDSTSVAEAIAADARDALSPGDGKDFDFIDLPPLPDEPPFSANNTVDNSTDDERFPELPAMVTLNE